MADSIITREAAAVLAAKFESLFAEDELRSGLQLYAEGAVSHVWQDGFSIVHGIVRNGRDVKLQLDLDFFEASECGCKARRCAHMAAVFFAVYAEHDQPQHWLNDVLALRHGQLRSGTERRRQDSPFRAGGNESSADARAESAADAPERWPELLDARLMTLQRRHNDMFRIDIFYRTAYKKLLSLADGWSEAAADVFRLYVPLFLLVRMDRHFAAHRESYPAGYYQRVTADLYGWFAEQLRDAAMRVDARTLHDRFRRHGEAMAALLRSGWQGEGNGPFDWPEIARYLWSHLLGDPAWLEEECRCVDALLEAGDPPPSAAPRLLAISAHLHWLSGRDDQAMHRLRQPGLAPTSVIVVYIETLYKAGSWERLARWLDFSLPFLRRASADQFQRVLTYWRQFAIARGEDGKFLEALAFLLPRSYLQYTDYLLSTERYREWADFHLLNGIAPDKIDRAQLERVKERNVRLLLPLYHHAIERQMAARSRSAYREAVKLMKRLKELYGEAGETGRFRQFVQLMAEKYQRLHAFQEELAKGKLLE